ncbi:hypothetical protein BCR42DRAFT_410615 [Absidia repens]|uniref:RRM domain-containing protein n=1 Tax=Absidia repens TaxID=90262 RepID=A0A1X2IQS1_9FUNG|nr:hypothetical protein BCR42DRAFT_410615 [Absidia repens]
MSGQSSPRISHPISIRINIKSKDYYSAPSSPSIIPQLTPQETTVEDVDDGPTAIVIKNIPFHLKKDGLMFLMQANSIPIPYALNYHFDNGVFRGLAFANYRNSQETLEAISGLTKLEVGGRKLRVEFKKALSFGPQFNISTTEEKNLVYNDRQYQPQSRIQPKNGGPPNNNRSMNLYDQIVTFIEDPTRDVFMPETYSGKERKDVHLIAEEFGLLHHSVGVFPNRYVQIRKKQTNETDLNTGGYQKPALEYTPTEPLSKRESYSPLRKPFMQSTETDQQNTIPVPIRQPRGPDLAKNFDSRKHLQQLSLSDILVNQRMSNLML